MREWTIYVGDGLLNLNDVIFIEISCIRKRKLIKTLKFH